MTAGPARAAVGCVKMLVRYLLGKPPLVRRLASQPSCYEPTTSMDTALANCLDTRRAYMENPSLLWMFSEGEFERCIEFGLVDAEFVMDAEFSQENQHSVGKGGGTWVLPPAGEVRE